MANAAKTNPSFLAPDPAKWAGGPTVIASPHHPLSPWTTFTNTCNCTIFPSGSHFLALLSTVRFDSSDCIVSRVMKYRGEVHAMPSDPVRRKDTCKGGATYGLGPELVIEGGGLSEAVTDISA